MMMLRDKGTGDLVNRQRAADSGGIGDNVDANSDTGHDEYASGSRMSGQTFTTGVYADSIRSSALREANKAIF